MTTSINGLNNLSSATFPAAGALLDAGGDGAQAASFADLMASSAGVSRSAAGDAVLSGAADLVSGRLGINLRNGRPSEFVYLDEQGAPLRTSTFTAKNLLKYADQFAIDLNQVTGLKQQLEAARIGYKPYELYPGTGSDHGIDFDDVLAGGLGSAYDWRRDANAALKDAALVGTAVEGQASRMVAEARAMADRLGVVKHEAVTTERGVDPARMTALMDGAGNLAAFAVMANGAASWYQSMTQAQQVAAESGGAVVDLSHTTPPEPFDEVAFEHNLSAALASLSQQVPTPSNDVASEPASLAQAASADDLQALQAQIDALSTSLATPTTTSMSQLLAGYNQLQALMAQLTQYEEALATTQA